MYTLQYLFCTRNPPSKLDEVLGTCTFLQPRAQHEEKTLVMRNETKLRTFEEQVALRRRLRGAGVPAEAVLEPVGLEHVAAETHLVDTEHFDVLEDVLCGAVRTRGEMKPVERITCSIRSATAIQLLVQ